MNKKYSTYIIVAIVVVLGLWLITTYNGLVKKDEKVSLQWNEVQNAYPSADVVGNERMVFNIKGNKYRLVVRFSFRYKAMQVKWIGTHAEYNNINVLEV